MNEVSFSVPLWAWAAVTLVIAVMLAVDLIAHRDSHVIGFKEAALWSGAWIAIGLAFGLVLLVWQGAEVSSTYYAGYLIEKALSVDNVFVFALVFSFFAVPDAYQHKVLFWGSSERWAPGWCSSSSAPGCLRCSSGAPTCSGRS